MQFPEQVTGSPWESKQPWLLSYVDSEWSVSSQIHKELVNVFQSLNENAIILHRCLLHSLHCGSGCSYLDFIGFVFFFSFFTTFLDRKSCSRVFFSFLSSDIPGFTAPALETLFILVQLMLTQHSNQTGTVYWTMRCQVTHSLSHSHKPASPLPSVPFAMFAKRHLALQAWREDLWPFKQTQALNGLSVCAAVGQNFLYVVHVCAPVCEHMFVFFMYGHNYCWILLHMRPTCAC